MEGVQVTFGLSNCPGLMAASSPDAARTLVSLADCFALAHCSAAPRADAAAGILPIVARLDDFWSLQILLRSSSAHCFLAWWSAHRWHTLTTAPTRSPTPPPPRPMHPSFPFAVPVAFFLRRWLAPLAASRHGWGPVLAEVTFLVWALPLRTGPLIPLPACGPQHELMQVTEERRMVQWASAIVGGWSLLQSPKVGKDRGQPADEIHPDPSD